VILNKWGSGASGPSGVLGAEPLAFLGDVV
jgi:hypothetical protein